MANQSSSETRLYWIHALTPLHVGAGRGVGYIDLPIMREKVTGWPLVPGTAFKGVLRDRAVQQQAAQAEIDTAFGRADDDGDRQANSGSLVFTDARLVCLPIRSLYGTFGWCTSAMALRRLRRDLEYADLCDGLAEPIDPGDTRAFVDLESDDRTVLSVDSRIYLEDLDFDPVHSADARSWSQRISQWLFPNDGSWQTAFRQRFVMVPDDAFNFLCETATQVDARVRIDEVTKTAQQGALWYEESLPAESVLAGLAWCDRIFGNNGMTARDLASKFCEGTVPLQLGGKATVGRGQTRVVFTEGI